MSTPMHEIDIIIETYDRDVRENFPYDEFREALTAIGITVWNIRFLT